MSRRIIFIIALVLLVFGTIVLLLTQRNKQASNSSAGTPLMQKYVALGDSVAAGQGLLTSSDSSACDRTQEAYPVLLTQNMQVEFTNVACSGATIQQGILGPQVVNGAAVLPQIERLTKDTSLVTITVGANDVGWSQVLTRCLLSQCGTDQDSAQSIAKQKELGLQLNQMMQTITSKISSSTKVLVTGYYQVFPYANVQCELPSGLTDSEMAWLYKQTEDLNRTIQSSTEGYDFAHFVKVDFTGHEACMSNSWIQGLLEAAPFHPTVAGQQAISQAVEQTIKSN